MLGWEWYLSIALSTCSSTPTFGLICVVLIFISSESVIFMKKSLNMFAILKSLVITCPFSNSVIPLSVCTFPEKEVLQLSRIFDYQICHLGQDSYSNVVSSYEVISHTHFSYA